MKNAAALYTLCRAVFISHLRYPHNVWQDIARFFSFVTNSSLTASISGCRGRQPLHQSSTAAKLLSLFADFTLYKRTQKAVQSFHSDRFAYIFILFFSIKSTFPIMGIYHSHRLQKRIYYHASHELHSTLFQVCRDPI